MRLFIFVLAFVLGGIATAYTPVADYVPPRDQMITSLQNAAPFLADWLPDVEVEPAQPALGPDTATTQLADEQEEDSDSSSVWMRLAAQDIESLLTEMELPTERLLLETGEAYIAVERDESFSFYLRPRRCMPTKDCAGLQIFSTFAADLPREQLTELNETYASVKFYTDTEGYLVLETHVSTDYGVSRQNVRSNIEMFVSVLDTFAETLNTEEESDIDTAS